ncbi:hypothetical protein KM043_014840 [Ampulex compressa]|nr:hypothetical protein KM043_014840 [Ampulex compressa]
MKFRRKNVEGAGGRCVGQQTEGKKLRLIFLPGKISWHGGTEGKKTGEKKREGRRERGEISCFTETVICNISSYIDMAALARRLAVEKAGRHATQGASSGGSSRLS